MCGACVFNIDVNFLHHCAGLYRLYSETEVIEKAGCMLLSIKAWASKGTNTVAINHILFEANYCGLLVSNCQIN